MCLPELRSLYVSGCKRHVVSQLINQAGSTLEYLSLVFLGEEPGPLHFRVTKFTSKTYNVLPLSLAVLTYCLKI